MRLISAEQNRNRAYATWGLHCSFQSVNLHHGATALRPLWEAVGKCPTVSFCNHGQYFIDAVENHVMYSSQFAIDTSVNLNNPLHHARRHAKGDEVDWPPYKIRYRMYPSRFIMISISQCITEDKTRVIETFGNTRFECICSKITTMRLEKEQSKLTRNDFDDKRMHPYP